MAFFPVADLIAAVHLEFDESSKKRISREWNIFSRRLIGLGFGALAAKAIKELAEHTFKAALVIDTKVASTYATLTDSVLNFFDNIAANVAGPLTRWMQDLSDALIALGPVVGWITKLFMDMAGRYKQAAELFGMALNQMLAGVYYVISKIPGSSSILPGAAEAAKFHQQEAYDSLRRFNDIQKEIGQKAKYISPEESKAFRKKSEKGGDLVTGAIENLQMELIKRQLGDPVAKAQLDVAQQSLLHIKSIDQKSGKGGAKLQ